MSLTWKVDSEQILVVQLSGLLGLEEFQRVQNRNDSPMNTGENIKVLIIAEAFDGWQEGAWDTVGFDDRVDDHVSKMAVVIDSKWHDDMALFMAKDLRPLPIEIFAPDQELKARQWLAED